MDSGGKIAEKDLEGLGQWRHKSTMRENGVQIRRQGRASSLIRIFKCSRECSEMIRKREIRRRKST